MYFKLEPQPVNQADYALPCCVRFASGRIPVPVAQLLLATTWWPSIPSQSPAGSLGGHPAAFPAWVVSLWLDQLRINMQTHARWPAALKPCCKSPVPVAAEICTASLQEHPQLICTCTMVWFSLQPDLYQICISVIFLHRLSKKETQLFPTELGVTSK